MSNTPETSQFVRPLPLTQVCSLPRNVHVKVLYGFCFFNTSIPDLFIFTSGVVVTLLDYGAGNVRSVRNAIRHLGFDIKDVFFLLDFDFKFD